MRSISRCSQRILLLLAVSLFAYCGRELLSSWIFQRSEEKQFECMLLEPKTTARNQTADLPRILPAGVVGRLEIARLGLSVMVMEGTGRATLRHAAGRVPGTAHPGQPGNIGISAHRDTFFRPLRHIAQDDVITLTTVSGAYRYRVVSTKIVAPDDISVLHSTASQILTLVTCYPFYFVGPAPQRFIVTAKRIDLGT